MHFIYCYENKINGHKYIGQTNNLKIRYSAHKSQSYNLNSKDYNCLFHQKIRQYGLDNFDFYVLEEIDNEDTDYVDFREQFWIEKLNSWCRNGKGYNQNTGGTQFKKNIKTSDEEVKEIKELLKTTNLTFSQIAEKFNTYRECIARINTGRYGYDSSINYPIRITRQWREVPQEIKQKIADEIITTSIPLKTLAKKYQVSEHLINQINTGLSNLEGDYKYPLRKTNIRLTQEQEEIIFNKLKNGETIKKISEELGINRSTISKRKKKYKL